MIALRKLHKSYQDVVAVKHVDLDVAQGEFVTLLGPSGCGKTTTLRMIAGFTTPTSGTIAMAGTDVTRRPPHKREVGLVFQSYALFPHMTVRDNVGFGLRMRRLPAAEIRRRVGEALELVKLAGLSERLPRELSGGQQQRVALARALVIRPQLLLLDEPFGALDKQLRDHMQKELRALQRQLSLPTLFVTHDQGEALSMSDRVVVMNAGGVEQIGTPLDVYERPGSEFVATFLGHSNILDAEVQQIGTATVLRSGPLVIPANRTAASLGSGRVMIRPERVALHAGQARDDRTSARVVATSYFGSSIEYVLDVQGIRLEAVTANPGAGFDRFAVGDTVDVEIPADAVWPLPDSR
ncbi:MAG: ABC transporter ATP-binding protein [Lautropia sp.]